MKTRLLIQDNVVLKQWYLISASENMELPESEANNKKQKKKAAPTIYYAS